MEPLQPTSPTPSSFPLLQPEDWSLTSRIALASIGSQGTMGTLLLTGFVSKNFYLSEYSTISENANILLFVFGCSLLSVESDCSKLNQENEALGKNYMFKLK